MLKHCTYNLQVAQDRATQVHEDIHKIMLQVPKAKSKAANQTGIASGSHAKASVIKNVQKQIYTKLMKGDLIKNKRGKVVFKAVSKASKKKEKWRKGTSNKEKAESYKSRR